jgi:DNA-directed RNA polymerase specialized sigma24 family protein
MHDECHRVRLGRMVRVYPSRLCRWLGADDVQVDHDGFLTASHYDRLFAARISGREPTEHEARLLEASRCLWAAALTAVTSQISATPSLAADPKSITSGCWEEALFSTLRTMDKLRAVHISDLDSYLFAIFTYRLNRYLARERKRQRIIEFVPESDDLAEAEGAKDRSWIEKIESRIALQEALARTDDWFRVTAWCYCHYFSWEQIGALFGLTKEQTRKRFEYGIRKLRRLLRKPPSERSGPE